MLKQGKISGDVSRFVSLADTQSCIFLSFCIYVFKSVRLRAASSITR